MNKVLLAYEDYPEMLTIQSVLTKVGFDVMTTSNEFSLSDMILSSNPDIVVGYGKGAKLSTLGVGRRLREMPRWSGKVILIFPAGLKADPAELAKVRMDLALEAPLEVTRLLQVLGSYTEQDPRALVEKMMKAVAQEGEERQVSGSPGGRDQEPIFVTGFREKAESWDVKGGQELEDFNRLMGLPPETPAPSKRNDSSSEKGEGPRSISRVSSAPKTREELGSVPVGTDEASSGPSFVVRDPLIEKEKAEALRARVKSYESYLEKLPPPTVNGHRLKDVKKAQKAVSQDWPSDELQDQDKLRREFTGALFKKND